MSAAPDKTIGRDRIPEGMIRTSLSHPWGMLAGWLALAILALPGVLALQVDTSTDSVLDRVHPDWVTYQNSQDLFGGDELLVIALVSDTPLDPASLESVRNLSEQLEGLQGVRRVDSLSTVPAIGLHPDGGLDLTPPLQDSPRQPEALQQHLRRRLQDDRIAPNSLVSKDERVIAINILLERGQEKRHDEILTQIQAWMAPTSGILSGVPVFRVVTNERTGTEILRFVPITAIVIAVLLALLFRSLLAIVLCFLPGILGSWILLGAMGYTGAPLSIVTMVLPSIILALGCAYAMHPLLAVSSSARPAPGGRIEFPALVEALTSVSLPIALSGMTTCIGFLSITLVRIEAVRSTGLYGAIGVFAVTLVTLTALPAMTRLSTAIWHGPAGLSTARERFATAIVTRAQRNGTAILVCWFLMALLASIGVWKVEVETDATRWLPPGHPIRDSYEEIRTSLSGISPMNVILRAPEGKSVLEPETLQAIDRLSEDLEARDDVGRTVAITDPLRQLGGRILEDPSQPIPESVNTAEQYLLLLESIDQIHDLITPDRRTTNVLIRANNNGSSDLQGIADYAESWWRQHAPADHSIETTGIMYEFARAQDEIAQGQLRGLLVALLVISLILFATFRWSALATASMIPNALPLLMIFGAMGLLSLPLDAGTVMIGCLALGVAVDDTIHISANFYAGRQAGLDAPAALMRSLSKTLPAIVCTSVIVGLAFAVIGLSEFALTRNLGLLTAGVMGLCLVADLTLLPALLLKLPPKPARLGGNTPAG